MAYLHNHNLIGFDTKLAKLSDDVQLSFLRDNEEVTIRIVETLVTHRLVAGIRVNSYSIS